MMSAGPARGERTITDEALGSATMIPSGVISAARSERGMTPAMAIPCPLPCESWYSRAASLGGNPSTASYPAGTGKFASCQLTANASTASAKVGGGGCSSGTRHTASAIRKSGK